MVRTRFSSRFRLVPPPHLTSAFASTSTPSSPSSGALHAGSCRTCRTPNVAESEAGFTFHTLQFSVSRHCAELTEPAVVHGLLSGPIRSPSYLKKNQNTLGDFVFFQIHHSTQNAEEQRVPHTTAANGSDAVNYPPSSRIVHLPAYHFKDSRTLTGPSHARTLGRNINPTCVRVLMVRAQPLPVSSPPPLPPPLSAHLCPPRSLATIPSSKNSRAAWSLETCFKRRRLGQSLHWSQERQREVVINLMGLEVSVS